MRPVIYFLLLAFGISWLLWLPLLGSGVTVVPGALPSHLPGLMGPALAAMMLAARANADEALWPFLRRTLFSPFRAAGLFALLSGPLLIGAGVLGHRLAFGTFPDLAGLGVYSGVPRSWPFWLTLLFVFIANGIGEELGWRGFLLPRLQARFGSRMGMLAVFPAWALWHLPNFFFLENFMEMSAAAMLFGWGLGLFAGNMVLAHIVHMARGNCLVAAFWHTSFNFASATALGPVVPAVATALVMGWAMILGVALLRGRGDLVLVAAAKA